MAINFVTFIFGMAIGSSIGFSNTNKYYMFNTLVLGLAGIAYCLDMLTEVI